MKRVSIIRSTVVITATLLLMIFNTAYAADTIRIGGLFAVTGPASFLGDPEKKTLEMLIREANAKGGINGMKVEAIIYDTAGDATKAVQLATRLIKDDRVSVIVGPSTTGETMAIIPVVERENIPLISCAAGLKITDPVKKWVFKTPANDHIAAEKILNHMSKQNQKTIALFTVTDGFGSSGREQIKALAAIRGFSIVADEVYGPRDTDMTAQLTRIRGMKPDAIICWGTNPGPAVITRNIKQLGIKIPTYMSHGVASGKFIELAGIEAAEGIMLPAGKLAVYDVLSTNDPQIDLLKQYDIRYKKLYGSEVSTFGGYAYDAFLLIASAIKNNGASPDQIRKGIEQTKNLTGVSGIYSMSHSDHNGLDLSAFEMVSIKRGNWVSLNTGNDSYLAQRKPEFRAAPAITARTEPATTVSPNPSRPVDPYPVSANKPVSSKKNEMQTAGDLSSDVDQNIPEGHKAGKYDVAVVIGNRNYSASGAPDVDYANRDAQTMRAYLTRTMGYDPDNVIYVEDATFTKFNELFGTERTHKGKLFNYVKEGKSKVFVYYVGHGAPDAESSEAYFVPVDANPQMLKISGYRLQTFYDNLAKLNAQKVTVVIDACFSGATQKGTLFKGTSALVRKEKAAKQPQNALVIASSSGEQFSSWYPEKRHSLFTYFFLKGLQGEADSNKDNQITVAEMKEYLAENVPYMARRLTGNEQVPQTMGNDTDVLVKLVR